MKMDDEEPGTPSNGGGDSSLDSTKVKSENIDKKRGPRGPYTVMEAAKVIDLKTLLSGFLVGMQFIGNKTIVVSGTPCAPEFLADMVVNRWLLHTPNYVSTQLLSCLFFLDSLSSCHNSKN